MRVLKFGGTSIGSAERIKKVSRLCLEQKADIVVLSAMSGSTNTLLAIIKNKAEKEVDKLFSHYKNTAYQLLEDTENLKQAIDLIEDQNSNINALLCSKEDAGKEILAIGEIISTHLLSFYLKENKITHQLLDACEIIRLDENNEPDQAFISIHLNQKIAKDRINIIQGFICMDAQGKTSNLSRGGSDYTASLVAEAANASEIQIWTDIDGFHNNDPRFIEKTSSISCLTYDEAAELAYFGAKILHPNTLIPAKRANIPVWLKNTLHPEQEGTLIGHETVESEIKAVAAKDGITAIKIKSSRMLLAYGFLRKVFQVFEDLKTPIDMIATSEVAVSLTIDNNRNLEKIKEALKELGEVEIDKDQSIICIVGNMIASDKGIVSKVFATLNDVPIRMVSYGGSRHNISVLVDEAHKVAALNSLHINLFCNETTTRTY